MHSKELLKKAKQATSSCLRALGIVNFCKVDVVLIADEQPRNKCLMGRVTEVFAGKDSVVRSVKVRWKSLRALSVIMYEFIFPLQGLFLSFRF